MASSSPPGLSLDEQLCFDLYAASRAVTARYRELLAPLHLTYPQYLVMIVVWERGAVTVSELGAALRLDSGTLSPLVQRLVSEGLVTKARGVRDERTVCVEATAAGHALRHRAHGIPRQICDVLGLEPADATALRDTLRLVSTRAAHRGDAVA